MKDNTKLVVYARDQLRGGMVYDDYRPKAHVLKQVVALLPRAHVVVVSGAWCSDCRREVPRFARIVERLPGWTVELRDDDAETRDVLSVRKIPTFVVRNPDTGEELGRIVESPESGSLEGDLLAIAERHPSRTLA
jgi:thiol-disulfide isomerase/thioredoxin